MAGLRFTELQSRPTEFLDFPSVTLEEFQQLVPPFETALERIWRRGASMGNLAPRAGFPCTRTAPGRHPRIGYCLFSPMSRPTRSRWSRGACSAWGRAKPISGFMSSCPCYWRRCAPSAMLLPAP